MEFSLHELYQSHKEWHIPKDRRGQIRFEAFDLMSERLFKLRERGVLSQSEMDELIKRVTGKEISIRQMDEGLFKELEGGQTFKC